MTTDEAFKCVALVVAAFMSDNQHEGYDDVVSRAGNYYKWLKYTRIEEDK